MKTYKISLKTMSPLLCASGESSALIDADVRYNRQNLPYIQARTFKGLLRESALEVSEMRGKGEALIEKLFGKSGGATGSKLHFQNLVLQPSEEMKKHLSNLPAYFTRGEYTEIISQTSIDEKSGTAEDKSLRTYRAVKKDSTFIGKMDVAADLSEEEGRLLEDAFSNLRYMGTRRNRGFGKVKVSCAEIDSKAESEKTDLSLKGVEGDEVCALRFVVRTENDVVIAQVVGEQNTVSTTSYIPAQNIRGIVAAALLSGIKNPAHQDKDFQNLVLNPAVAYFPAFLKGTRPAPRIYGYDKTAKKGDESYNNLEFVHQTSEALKGLSGFLNECNEKQNPLTQSNFHSARPDRSAGRSKEENGGIFYYEALEEGQGFEALIVGRREQLAAIHGQLNKHASIHRIGKSKSAQYGRVSLGGFELKPLKDVLLPKELAVQEEISLNDEYLLVFHSPVINYNANGMAIPDKAILEREIKAILGEGCEIDAFVAATSYVESYMGVWKAKTPRELAFEVGTTVLLRGKTSQAKMLELVHKGLGERRHEGYGRVRWEKRIKKLEEKGDGENGNKRYTSDLVAYKAQLHLAQLKQDAVELAQKHAKNLSNSLVSRLKDELKASSNEQTWVGFMNGIEKKKAGQKLTDCNLFGKLKALTVKNETDLEIRKTYWLTFLKTLRTLQKKK